MTEKTFWQDPYLTELKAKITKIDGNKVNVDKTIFFAFSGGQESDEGTIGGLKVINAVKLGDKENVIDICYELEKPPNFKVNDEVDILINKDKRDKIRRIHSATHVVYYYFAEKLGELKLIGSNVTADKARMDFNYDKPINDMLPDIEKKTNDFMAKNHKIGRKPDENNPDLLYLICSDWKMPCGGTHVKSTGEIGMIKLKRKNIGAGKERVEIYLE